MSAELPTLRWGIVATGLISSWFVTDLVVSRKDVQANHVIQAIGSSSVEKGSTFAAKHLPGATPTIYGNYDSVFADPAVDVIYIGTPHAFHKQNCLDAIRHGKHVLCEKAFCLNAADARDVFDAARQKGVFVMEAMWTRFFPLVQSLHRLVHEERVVGDVHRVFCDFGMKTDLASLGPDSRLRNPALGAGTLLDIGIYSLTWALLFLDPGIGREAARPTVKASQTLDDGVDIATSTILQYPSGKQGIVTSSMQVKTAAQFCRVEGSEGHIAVEGLAASVPGSFTVYPTREGSEPKRYDFERPGKGFYWEADAVAQAIAGGQKESNFMPWEETVRVLEIMDEIRRQGGARFPQDRL